MAVYSIANRTSNVTIANPNLELRTAATDRLALMELGWYMAAATASTIGLGRPQAIGITPTSPQTVLAEDVADPVGTATTALAWGTAPTVPLNFFRRLQLPATIGAGITLVFPRGIIVPVSSSIITWNISASGVSDVHVVVDE